MTWGVSDAFKIEFVGDKSLQFIYNFSGSPECPIVDSGPLWDDRGRAMLFEAASDKIFLSLASSLQATNITLHMALLRCFIAYILWEGSKKKVLIFKEISTGGEGEHKSSSSLKWSYYLCFIIFLRQCLIFSFISSKFIRSMSGCWSLMRITTGRWATRSSARALRRKLKS